MAGALPPDPEMSNQAFFRVNFEGEVLVIPERIYTDLSKLRVRSPLSEEERVILHCLLSRHYNGYEREAALREIITSPFPWVTPFVIRLVGEYVIEILNVVDANLAALDHGMYKRFLKDNDTFYSLTKSRIASYWDCYYKANYSKNEYVGFKIADFFDSMLR